MQAQPELVPLITQPPEPQAAPSPFPRLNVTPQVVPMQAAPRLAPLTTQPVGPQAAAAPLPPPTNAKVVHDTPVQAIA